MWYISIYEHCCLAGKLIDFRENPLRFFMIIYRSTKEKFIKSKSETKNSRNQVLPSRWTNCWYVFCWLSPLHRFFQVISYFPRIWQISCPAIYSVSYKCVSSRCISVNHKWWVRYKQSNVLVTCYKYCVYQPVDFLCSF